MFRDGSFIIPVIAMGGLGFMFAFLLAVANRKLYVEMDPKLKKIEEILPGLNCGACGWPSCTVFGEAVLKGDIFVDGCKAGGKECAEKLADLLGIELKVKDPKIAIVHCAGGLKEADERFIYDGLEDCNAVSILSGGHKLCVYGCLRMGSCVKACPFNAIKLNENHIPEVDPDKCTACGLCVKACPRDLISLQTRKRSTHVRCTSLDKGKVVKGVCRIGCIGCGICQKVCPYDAIHVVNNIAVMDYEKCVDCGECVKKCPTKAITGPLN